MKKYRLVAKRGEGTFSEVIKAQHIKSGTFHAIKCMKNFYRSADQVNSLREIQAIKRLTPHPNIVKLEEVLYDPPSGRLALVFELLEGNLYELMKDRHQQFSESTVKTFMRQIFSSLDHMHGKGVFHRDIKPENILVDKNGKTIKLADFGSCRGINGKPPFTEYISTRWYRPPECLLTCGVYGPEMDIWAAGCILFELTTLYPLFPGSDEADQINRIHRVLGTPQPRVADKLRRNSSSQARFNFQPQKGIGLSMLLPDATESYLDILSESVAYEATKRITAKDAIKHSYFVGDSIVRPRLFHSSTESKRFIQKQDVTPSTNFTYGYNKSTSKYNHKPDNGVSAANKSRSMVSVLLARSNQNDCNNKSMTKTVAYYEGKRNKNIGSFTSEIPASESFSKHHFVRDGKVYNGGSDAFNGSTKLRRKTHKYAHVKSSGYGASSSITLSSNNYNTPGSNMQKGYSMKGHKLPPLSNRTHRGNHAPPLC